MVDFRGLLTGCLKQLDLPMSRLGSKKIIHPNVSLSYTENII